MGKKVVIVGGVAGGASAAARLRRLDENAEIVMFERGEYISFANCGLPYYIGEVIGNRDALLVQTKEGMEQKFNLTIHALTEVVRIDRENKKVLAKNLKTGEDFEESYDVLLLSPGANPVRPPIPGLSEAKNVFTLRNIPDTDAIKAFVDEHHPKNAVVIGGGFIGLEMAENLIHRGVKVHLVEMSDQVMAPLDKEMASQVHQELSDHGVNLYLGNGISGFDKEGKEVILQKGERISTEMTLLSIGVRPENGLAKEAGLALGERGGILVDAYLRTEDSSIYAIGDAIEVKDYINGTPTMIPLAWPANRQGRMAADNIAGGSETYPGTLGTAIVKIFGLTVATTGANEKTLKRLGKDYGVMHIHPNSHAGYYPGAFPMQIKVIFDAKSKRILGAQAIGMENVDKAIDGIAIAIKANLPVDKLQDLELCYAPPYSSAKNPINFVGYVAENLLTDKVKTIQWHEVDELIKKGECVVDVSEEQEFMMGHIPGSINMPLSVLRENCEKLPEKVYVYCRVGVRGYIASRILRQKGKEVYNLDGGYRTYSLAYCGDENSSCQISGTEEESKEDSAGKEPKSDVQKIVINACGLQCPGPIMQVFKAMQKMHDGEYLEISVTDPGFTKDISSWCEKTGNTLVSLNREENSFRCLLKKGRGDKEVSKQDLKSVSDNGLQENATLVVFSGDLDKAMASFIIASGAAAMGKQVTMFFTFWGLNIIKKANVKTEKSFMEKMFAMMMPKDASKLPLSKMNMGGAGTMMMKKVMKDKHVDSLEYLMENAKNAGVKMIACAMSMDVMGIKEEELIDGVEVGGVATYLGKATEGNVNLFI